MNHAYFLRLLSSYVDDEVSADERQQMENHIERCSVCKQKLYEMRMLKSGIHETAGLDLPDNFAFSVMRRMRNEEEGMVRWLGPEIFAKRLVLALSIIVICLLGLGSLLQPEQPITIERYLSGDHQDSLSQQVLSSNHRISKDDVLFAAVTK